MTFGNRNSVASFQTVSEFLKEIFLAWGVCFFPYIDDYIIVSAQGLAAVHTNFVKEALKVLGFGVSPKRDGVLIGEMNTPVEVLGLNYITSENGVKIVISPDRVQIIQETIDQALKKLKKGDNPS